MHVRIRDVEGYCEWDARVTDDACVPRLLRLKYLICEASGLNIAGAASARRSHITNYNFGRPFLERAFVLLSRPSIL